MKKSLLKLFCLILAVGFTACKDDDGPSAPTEQTVQISVTHPTDAGEFTLVSEAITFHNVATRIDTTFTDLTAIKVIPGLYDVDYDAEVLLENGATSHLRANQSSVQIGEGTNSLSIFTYNNITTDDLVIAEVFFSGTLTESGDQYAGTTFFKLFNNTDHVVYADGISIFESNFLTTDKENYTPDIMEEDVAIHALYTVPGNGTEHPVQPGEYFLIADQAMDHSKVNSWSFDLSHADFEWYDETSNPRFPDIDNPAVPNMTKVYCYTATTFSLHNRGFRAFGIARLPISTDKFISDYTYDYEYEMVLPTGTYAMGGSTYRLPNEWVVDVVNCSVESEYAWNVTSSKLDCGWAHCGSTDQDKTRYFKSVRRKLLYITPEGRIVLKDTNNSTADFNSDVICSEIELQGSVMNASGEKATTITYDGVTPVLN